MMPSFFFGLSTDGQRRFFFGGGATESSSFNTAVAQRHFVNNSDHVSRQAAIRLACVDDGLA